MWYLKFFKKNYSLSFRLQMWTLGGCCIFVILIFTAIFYQVKIQQSNLLDYQLQQIAHTVADISVDPKFSKNILKADKTLLGDIEDVGWHIDLQVWRGSELLYTSADNLNLGEQTVDGLSVKILGDRDDSYKARVYTLRSRGETIQVMHSSALRQDLINSGLLQVLVPVLIALIVFGIIFSWLVRKGLQPLRDLEQAIASRDVFALDQFELQRNAPSEIMTITHSLNSLIQKLSHSFDTHKQFIAIAAHELRTPIAGLQIATDVLAQNYIKADGATIFKGLKNGVERCAVLINQLLDLSRLESNSAYPLRRLDMVEELGKSLMRHTVKAQDKQVDLLLLGESKLMLNGNAAALQLLFDNVLLNAIRFAPSGTKVEVRLGGGTSPVVAQLTVRDYGPGLTEEECRKALQAFVRFDGHNAGTGLGLAIAAQVAQLHHASLTLKRPKAGAGLVAEVIFYQKTAWMVQDCHAIRASAA